MSSYVLITGANGEIGRAVARAFAAEGATLALTDLNPAALESFAAELPTEAHVFRHDVANGEETAELARQLTERFGALDTVITSAGLYEHLPFATLKPGDWARGIAINLDGVYLTLQAVLPLIRDGGSIINIASMAGHRGSADHAPYASAKGGVLALTRSLAQELGPRIRVNAISPGLIDTRMMQSLAPDRVQKAIEGLPLRRLGRVEEVASVAVFLAGPGASYISGEAIQVNGGLYMA
ncbi:3-oxoacyl-[acyl-carrier protein] reductase [Kaistia hirudinis]|uniref:3-oxoacyl-[acyl-carrier protein] reductase n=1 Tax=Kaistia hirudinis TaxID=1293440 RepID=A0A840ARC0_9HYPH|nr:SDR family NAD(P)-dependent oxidoreductase [Kaistia hirudinis]MBB3931803.1 3-oxoacyl-[acyl-carrier protein] reductase [Kaistia hirudinis]